MLKTDVWLTELHLEIGCLSIILQEHAGDWARVPHYLEKNLP